jgi:hypothetical protein
MKNLWILLITLGICSCSLSIFKKKSKIQNYSKLKRPLKAGPSKSWDYFIDKTDQYGLKGVEAKRINVVDFNNDGYSDLVFTPTEFSQPMFYKFDNQLKKYLKISYNPFKNPVTASYLLFYDLDKDGVRDVIVGVLNQKSELSKSPIKIFKGTIVGGKIYYTLLTTLGKAMPSSSISVLDVDNDGNLDIFVGNWFGHYKGRPVPAHDQLFIYRKGKYIDSTSKLQDEDQLNSYKDVYINANPTFSSSICDVNDDGYADILTTSTNGFLNTIWLNGFRLSSKDRQFSKVSSISGYAQDYEGIHTPQGGGHSFFSSCADYNNDLFYDIFLGEVTHVYDPESKDRSSILTRSSAKDIKFFRMEYFLDSTDKKWVQADKRGVWVDYNQDGLLDLIVDNSGYPPNSRLILFEQKQDREFVSRAPELGIDILNPNATVVLDINNDGRPDILTSQTNIRDSRIKPRVYLFESNIVLPKNRKIVRVYLNGVKANSHGIGSSVTLNYKFESREYNNKKYINPSQGGLPSQNEEGLFFNFPKSASKINFSVRWPIKRSLNDFLVKKYEFERGELFKAKNITLCEDNRIIYKKARCN